MIASPRLERHKRRHCEGIITGTFYMSAVCAFTVYNLSTTSTPCSSRKTTPTSKFTLASGSECLLRKESKTWARWTKWSEGTSESLLNINNKCEWSFIQFSRVEIHPHRSYPLSGWAESANCKGSTTSRRNEFVLWLGSGGEKAGTGQRNGKKAKKIISNIHSQTRRRFLHLTTGTSRCADIWFWREFKFTAVKGLSEL